MLITYDAFSLGFKISRFFLPQNSAFLRKNLNFSLQFCKQFINTRLLRCVNELDFYHKKVFILP